MCQVGRLNPTHSLTHCKKMLADDKMFVCFVANSNGAHVARRSRINTRFVTDRTICAALAQAAATALRDMDLVTR